MGKSLKNSNLVTRPQKLAFFKVLGESIYRRMEGFTELSNGKNPKEYSRQYVDEDFERTDIVGYAPEKSYAFDRYKGNPVLDDIVYVTENELIGQDMIREILVVDLTTVSQNTTTSSTNQTAEGKLREWAIIPDTDGDTTDCLTYSGSFKARGEMENVYATTYDNWQTISIVTTDNTQIDNVTISIKASDIEIGSLNAISDTTNTLKVTTSENSIVIDAIAKTKGATLTLFKAQGTSVTSTPTIVAQRMTSLTYTDDSIGLGTTVYYLIVSIASKQRTVTIEVTKEE